MNSLSVMPASRANMRMRSAVSSLTLVWSGTVRLPNGQERPERENVVSVRGIEPLAVVAVFGSFRHVSFFLPRPFHWKEVGSQFAAMDSRYALDLERPFSRNF